MSNNYDNTEWKVYKLTSPNGRVYIGCTKLPLEKRWQSGRNYKSNEVLFNDIVHFGWQAFTKEVLLTTVDEHEARETEHREIKRYPNGYNLYRSPVDRTPTGNPPSQPKLVLCVETHRTYNSVHSAANETGLSRIKISECCNGKRKRTGGYHWKFIEPNMSL